MYATKYWMYAVIIGVAQGLDSKDPEPVCDTETCTVKKASFDTCQREQDYLRNQLYNYTSGTNTLIDPEKGTRTAVTTRGDFNVFLCSTSSTLQIQRATYAPQNSETDACSNEDDGNPCGCLDVTQSPVLAECNGKHQCGVIVTNSVFNKVGNCAVMELKVVYSCKSVFPGKPSVLL